MGIPGTYEEPVIPVLNGSEHYVADLRSLGNYSVE